MTITENAAITLLASAARTATTSSSVFENREHDSGTFIFDITAVPGVDTVTFSVVGVDPTSGKTWTILAGTAQVGTGTNVYKVGPGLVAAANATSQDRLPRRFKVTITASAASSFTYSCSAMLAKT